jgi:hypothetical protein
MGGKTVREERSFECRDEQRTAKLLVEWQEKDGERVLKSVSCDHPRFGDIDNWDCHWTCWEAVKKNAK